MRGSSPIYRFRRIPGQRRITGGPSARRLVWPLSPHVMSSMPRSGSCVRVISATLAAVHSAWSIGLDCSSTPMRAFIPTRYGWIFFAWRMSGSRPPPWPSGGTGRGNDRGIHDRAVHGRVVGRFIRRGPPLQNGNAQHRPQPIALPTLALAGVLHVADTALRLDRSDRAGGFSQPSLVFRTVLGRTSIRPLLQKQAGWQASCGPGSYRPRRAVHPAAPELGRLPERLRRRSVWLCRRASPG